MNMTSLRSLASIAISSLALALFAPAASRSGAESLDAAKDQTAAADANGNNVAAGSENSDTKGKESDTDAARAAGDNQNAAEKGAKKFRWLKHSKADEKNGDEKPEAKTAEPVPLSASEAAAVAAAAERAKQLKTYRTPFNVQASDSGSDDAPAAISAPAEPNSLRSRLAQRLGSSSRVYLPGKLTIGKPAEFVVKGRPGSHAAIAMADKDAGARSLLGRKLRLGADRKLMAAGTIPDSGILTLIVDMPIQGDLIGLPVFFEAVVWQKDDFSDLEIASPVKSESAEEIADKANAVIVSGEKEQKRGLRFTPGSGVPLYQQQNGSLESGKL